MRTEKLQANYNDHKLDVLGEVTKEQLDQIYNAVESSELIEQKHIKRILEEKN